MSDGRTQVMVVGASTEVVIQGDSVEALVSQARVEVVTVGIPGSPGASAENRFEQTVADVTDVVITHNLNKRPAVTIIDTAGDECEAAVIHLSTNSLEVLFSASFSGVIVCN